MAEDFLIELNGAAAVNAAKAGSALKVMNVEPFLIENLKEGKGNKKDPILSARHVVVDTEIKQVLIYELVVPERNADGTTMIAKPKLIASFPITPGKVKFIPKGFWNLKNSIELPVWRYDQQLLDTGVRGKNSLSIPAGPNNPVGVIWNGLTKSGIGLHGTNNPVTIGRARSAGCIRMANWDAIRFPTLVRPGAVVVVR
jgi:lipoprotein-anchoring transpeptidase ErfK/SrfK